MRNALMSKAILLRIKAEKKFYGVVEKLSEKDGSFLEEAIKYVIYFVVGALLLAGIYALFKTVILPTLQTKTQDMFNYSA